MKYILPLIIALLAITSCTKFSSSLDDKIIITMQEFRISSYRGVQLYQTTSKQYDCGNYSISGSIDREGNGYVLQITGVTKPETCSTGHAPARNEVEIDIKSNGVIPFTIKNGNKKVKGAFNIDDDHIIAVFPANEIAVFEYDTLMRMPLNTLWGYFMYKDSVSAAAADTILNALGSFGAQPYAGKPGFYGDFTVDVNRNIIYKYPTGQRPFIFSFNGNKEELSEFLKIYRIRYPLTLTIQMQVYEKGL